MKTTGKKNDQDYLQKPPLCLIPSKGLWEVGKVFGYGIQKYGTHNWRGGLQYSRLISGVLRHITAFNDNEDLDPETNLPHLAHAICGLFMLLEMNFVRPDLDDRYKNSDEMKKTPPRPTPEKKHIEVLVENWDKNGQPKT